MGQCLQDWTNLHKKTSTWLDWGFEVYFNVYKTFGVLLQNEQWVCGIPLAPCCILTGQSIVVFTGLCFWLDLEQNFVWKILWRKLCVGKYNAHKEIWVLMPI